MKVFVTNIPLNVYVDGWVTVPDDTPPEKLQDAIGEALCEKGFEKETPTLDVEDAEVDEGAIRDGWEFSFPLEG